MKSFRLSTPIAFTLGCCALLTLSLPGCDQAETETKGDEVQANDTKKAKKAKKSEKKQDKAPEARELVQELRADCASTMQNCAAVTDAGVAKVCETQLAGVCELVKADAQADEVAPCGEGTRCELMQAIHACFKAAGGCDGQIAQPGDDCLLKGLSKLPACIGQAMKDHGGDCGGGGCPGNGSGCEECDQAAPGDGCLLDPGAGGSCPAGGCLLQWVKSMTAGEGGCLLGWLGKLGEGCPGCDGQ